MVRDIRFDTADSEVPYDEEYLKAEESEESGIRCIRAEHEDDDGYDPYSDRTEPEPLFQKDPWE